MTRTVIVVPAMVTSRKCAWFDQHTVCASSNSVRPLRIQLAASAGDEVVDPVVREC